MLTLTGFPLLAAALAGFGLTTPTRASARAARMLYVDAAAVFIGGFTLLWFFVIDLGAAALHPSMRRLADAPPSLESGVSVGRIALLGCASLALPAAFVAQQTGIASTYAWDARDLLVVTLALVAIPALVIYRLVDSGT